MKVETKESIDAICPFCEAELGTIWTKELKGSLGKRYVYFCPKCKKVLGLSHRKGFWMG